MSAAPTEDAATGNTRTGSIIGSVRGSIRRIRRAVASRTVGDNLRDNLVDCAEEAWETYKKCENWGLGSIPTAISFTADTVQDLVHNYTTEPSADGTIPPVEPSKRLSSLHTFQSLKTYLERPEDEETHMNSKKPLRYLCRGAVGWWLMSKAYSGLTNTIDRQIFGNDRSRYYRSHESQTRGGGLEKSLAAAGLLASFLRSEP